MPSCSLLLLLLNAVAVVALDTFCFYVSPCPWRRDGRKGSMVYTISDTIYVLCTFPFSSTHAHHSIFPSIPMVQGHLVYWSEHFTSRLRKHTNVATLNHFFAFDLRQKSLSLFWFTSGFKTNHLVAQVAKINPLFQFLSLKFGLNSCPQRH